MVVEVAQLISLIALGLGVAYVIRRANHVMWLAEAAPEKVSDKSGLAEKKQGSGRNLRASEQVSLDEAKSEIASLGGQAKARAEANELRHDEGDQGFDAGKDAVQRLVEIATQKQLIRGEDEAFEASKAGKDALAELAQLGSSRRH